MLILNSFWQSGPKRRLRRKKKNILVGSLMEMLACRVNWNIHFEVKCKYWISKYSRLEHSITFQDGRKRKFILLINWNDKQELYGFFVWFILVILVLFDYSGDLLPFWKIFWSNDAFVEHICLYASFHLRRFPQRIPLMVVMRHAWIHNCQITQMLLSSDKRSLVCHISNWSHLPYCFFLLLDVNIVVSILHISLIRISNIVTTKKEPNRKYFLKNSTPEIELCKYSIYVLIT